MEIQGDNRKGGSEFWKEEGFQDEGRRNPDTHTHTHTNKRVAHNLEWQEPCAVDAHPGRVQCSIKRCKCDAHCDAQVMHK